MKSEPNKKPKRLKSINVVLLSYFLLFAALLIIFVEVVCYFVVKSTAEASARERLTSTGREVATVIKNYNEPDVSIYLRSFGKEGINIFVLDFDGNVILPSYGVAEQPSIQVQTIERLLNEVNAGESVLFTENNNLNYVSFVNYGGQKYLVATYSLNIIKGTMGKLVFYLLIIGILVLFLSALISWYISQRLSGGIKNLSTTAVKFSEGDLNVNFANAEYQELADLSDTLNSVRDEVKKSSDFQHEILANVSHDLKTPLTMIKAYASMIREISGDNPEKRDKHLQVIIDEADRLTGLVNDVLNVSKVTSNLDTINFKVFNLTEFLYGIINKFEYLQETQGFNIMVDIQSNLYTRADEEKIGQVFYNLIGNAVNYTGKDKTIYVSLKSSLTDDRIKFSVRDTGKGISKDDLPEIWNRYYRVKENHARPVKGTGLGLNIVKIILQNHSFDFGVQSELDKGSTFWIDFPSVPSEIEV